MEAADAKLSNTMEETHFSHLYLELYYFGHEPIIVTTDKHHFYQGTPEQHLHY